MGCQVSPHELLQTSFEPAEIFPADFRWVVADEVGGFLILILFLFIFLPGMEKNTRIDNSYQ